MIAKVGRLSNSESDMIHRSKSILASTGLALTLISALAGCATQPDASSALLPDSLLKPAGYSLVWADEFEQDGQPDESRWTYDTSRNSQGWYNDELQYYPAARSQNARIEDGHLIIEARKDPAQIKNYADWGGQDYSSARLLSKDKAAWTYGYFEVRAKLPCGRGLWPAIWMLSQNGDKWPDDGEIDIMEYVGFQPDTFHATIHTQKYNHTKGTQVGTHIEIEDACGAFQTHALLWTPDRITLAVNGQPYFSYENDGKGKESWPFDAPFFLIMNIAVGGSWGGQQGIDESIFPAQMEVDYVRVYQEPDSVTP